MAVGDPRPEMTPGFEQLGAFATASFISPNSLLERTARLRWGSVGISKLLLGSFASLRIRDRTWHAGGTGDLNRSGARLHPRRSPDSDRFGLSSVDARNLRPARASSRKPRADCQRPRTRCLAAAVRGRLKIRLAEVAFGSARRWPHTAPPRCVRTVSTTPWRPRRIHSLRVQATRSTACSLSYPDRRT